MKCNTVKDLLPNYMAGLTDEKTNIEIKKHVNKCSDCHTVYKRMSATNPQEILSEEDKNSPLPRKLKRKTLRRNIIATSIFIVVLVGFFIFANNFERVLPFDEYRMSVELIPHAVITNEDGKIIWSQLDYIEPTDYDTVINVLTRVYRGINNISGNSNGRTINRNGKNIRVVYYYYSKTLWNSLFIDSDLQEYSESGTAVGTDMYGDSYQSMDYEPQMIEVYYLPDKNLYNKMDMLSDEEYDQLRENRMQVWSGEA